MYNNRTFLAVVPARGGSKRLPRKNILELNGKPLIAYTIEAGLKSRYLDDVVVTSDDETILEVSRKYGASILKRPCELATDTASSYEVVKHTIENMKKYDYIVLLQPTSPLRNEKHIDEAIELLEEKKADAIVSVCEMEHNPLWCNILPDNHSMRNFMREDIKNIRSQDLEKYYRLNGAIYICKTDKFLKEGTFMISDNIYAYIMDRNISIDIDEKIDFQLAAIYLKEEK